MRRRLREASPLLESPGCTGGTWPGLEGCQGDRTDICVRREHSSGKFCRGEEGQEHRAEGPWCAATQTQARTRLAERQLSQGEAAGWWPGAGCAGAGRGPEHGRVWRRRHWTCAAPSPQLCRAEGPGGGCNLPQGDELRDGHSSG